jgi:peptidoglycan/LPS O-acetylase OafA/YrhL
LRVWTNRNYPEYANLTHHYATHLRMDALMFGVLLSYLYHYHQQPLVRWLERFRGLVLVVSLALLLPALVQRLGESPFLSSYGLTMLYAGFGGLVLLTATAPPGAVPLARRQWVLAIGRDSYSIYLWHMEVALHVWPLLQAALPSTTATTRLFADPFLRIVGAVLFGRLMAFLVEAPFLRLRDRYFPGRASGSLLSGACVGGGAARRAASVRACPLQPERCRHQLGCLKPPSLRAAESRAAAESQSRESQSRDETPRFAWL